MKRNRNIVEHQNLKRFYPKTNQKKQKKENKKGQHDRNIELKHTIIQLISAKTDSAHVQTLNCFFFCVRAREGGPYLTP